MTLQLELGGIQDPDVLRAFEQVSTQFPLRGANIANDVLLLAATGTARKVAFGVSTVTWAGVSPGATLTGVAHGLGVTPQLVGCFDTGGTNWIAAPESGSLTATTFDIFIRTADGGAGGAGSTQNIGWVAIG